MPQAALWITEAGGIRAAEYAAHTSHRRHRPQPHPQPQEGRRNSDFESSSMLTSLNVTTRTDLTNLAGR